MPAAAKPVHTTKIQVAKIYAPDSGRGPHRVFDRAARTYYKIWPDKLEQTGITENMTYAVTYTTEDYQGKAQHTIIGAQPVTGAAPASPMSTAQAQVSQADKEKNIIVEALAKSPRLVVLAESGDRAAIAQILQTLWEGWQLFKQPKFPPKQQSTNVEDPSDEIPY